MANERIVVIGAGIESCIGIRHAKGLGYRVIAVDGDPQAPGFQEADAQILASTYDIPAVDDGVRRYVQQHGPIHGVLSLAADVPRTVAAVAKEWHLPGLSPRVAEAVSDKLLMKTVLKAQGIPIPWFQAVANAQALDDIIRARGTPLIIKPVDSRGARGVLLLTDEDPGWVFNYTQQFSPTQRVMVEEYLPGPQISTETVLHDGWAVTPGFIDRNYAKLLETQPYMIEDGGEQPTHLSDGEVLAVKHLVHQAARALGITEGIAKGDVVLTPDGPKIIEMAGRLSGGYMSSLQIPHATGIDLIGIAVRLACRQSVTAQECIPQFQRGIAIRYLWPTPGFIRHVDTTALAEMTGVIAWDVSVQVGERLAQPTSHPQRAGWVMTEASTREEAVRLAEHAIQSIVVQTGEDA